MEENIEKLREMVYSDERIHETILAKGFYKNHDFIIVSIGTHPCCYIRLNPDDDAFEEVTNNWGEYADVNCHGGVTWQCVLDKQDGDYKAGSWIGWDYAHANDQYGNPNGDGWSGKPWTTEELIREVQEVVNNLF